MKHLLQPFAKLLCIIATLFVFSSFTAPQPRGGGDDEAIQLEYEISYGPQSLDTAIPWVLGDRVILGFAPYWVTVNNNPEADGVLCLSVQSNPYSTPREDSFHMTVYSSNGQRYECDVHIVQAGRRN